MFMKKKKKHNEILYFSLRNFLPHKKMANFEIIESNSALRNFARVYTINCIEWYDARSFFRRCERKYDERFTE